MSSSRASSVTSLRALCFAALSHIFLVSVVLAACYLTPGILFPPPNDRESPRGLRNMWSPRGPVGRIEGADGRVDSTAARRMGKHGTLALIMSTSPHPSRCRNGMTLAVNWPAKRQLDVLGNTMAHDRQCGAECGFSHTTATRGKERANRPPACVRQCV